MMAAASSAVPSNEWTWRTDRKLISWILFWFSICICQHWWDVFKSIFEKQNLSFKIKTMKFKLSTKLRHLTKRIQMFSPLLQHICPGFSSWCLLKQRHSKKLCLKQIPLRWTRPGAWTYQWTPDGSFCSGGTWAAWSPLPGQTASQSICNRQRVWT